MRLIFLTAVLLSPLLQGISQTDQTNRSPRTQNVILVMTDGLRWQEVFRGADETLLTPDRYYDKRPVDTLKKRFLASTPEARRALLLPFLWNTFIPQGQIFGDRPHPTLTSPTASTSPTPATTRPSPATPTPASTPTKTSPTRTSPSSNGSITSPASRVKSQPSEPGRSSPASSTPPAATATSTSPTTLS